MACQPAARREGGSGKDRGGEDEFGVAVVRDLEASMPEMLSDMNVGVPDAISYAEVPPTSMKIKVKKFGQDDAEMSPSVEVTNNVQVRPDEAEMGPSVEIGVTKFGENDAEMSVEGASSV